MCGRFTQADLDKLDETLFQLFGISSFEPRYNIAPTQDAAVIRDGADGRTIEPIRWGLVPSWANDPKMAMRTINARAESVATKPAFKESFRSRRCVIPVSGFYEWKKSGSTKQPFLIHPPSGHFALAGLWDRWFSHTVGPVETFTIITTDANDALMDLHDRMPVILGADAIDAWLDPENRNTTELQALLHPAPSTLTDSYPVSTFVNNVANEGAMCIERVETEPT
jgi:putative SOS response-associated peptidase YedK